MHDIVSLKLSFQQYTDEMKSDETWHDLSGDSGNFLQYTGQGIWNLATTLHIMPCHMHNVIEYWWNMAGNLKYYTTHYDMSHEQCNRIWMEYGIY